VLALGPHFGTVPKQGRICLVPALCKKMSQCRNWDGAETGANIYINFIDNLQSSGLKPYLTANTDEICLSSLHFFMFGVTRQQMENQILQMCLTFQALTNSTGKALDQVRVLKVLHRRDTCMSPLLPATWAIIFNIETNLDNKCPRCSTCSKMARPCLESFSTH